MSGGLCLYCPNCGERTALKKEYDFLPVKIKVGELKNPNDWRDTQFPVYTCQNCKAQWAIERVNK